MHETVAVLGAVLIVVALIGFVRSLWRSPPRGGGNSGYGAIPGESPHDGGHGGDGAVSG